MRPHLPPVGARIRTRVPFSGVPAGTTGRVIRHDENTAAIAWDLPGRDVPLVDWFTPEEVAKFLEVL